MKHSHRMTWLCLTAAASVAGTALAADPPPPSPPSSAIYGGLDQESAALVRTWYELYWSRLQTGEAHEDAAAFSFPPPLNSPLFNPARAGHATVARLGLAAAADPGETPPAESEFMLHGRLATDIHANAAGTAEHLRLISQSSPGDYTVAIEGTALVTWGLKPVPVENVSPGAQPAAAVSPHTLNAILALVEEAPAFAQAATGVEEWQKLITGEASKADNFRFTVEMMMFDWPVDVVFVEPVDAVFGVYGSLPLTVVSFADAYVLMDPFTGNVAGPFEPGTPLDASSLLQHHPESYVPGSAISYFDMWGQAIVAPEVLAGTQPGQAEPPNVPDPNPDPNPDPDLEPSPNPDPAPNPDPVPAPRPAQLRIRCKRIMNIPFGPASHCWIEYVPPDGDNNNPDICGGHPAWPTFEPDPQDNNFPWGPIVPYCGPWKDSPEKGFPDDPRDPFGGVRTTPIRCKPGTDLQAVYDCIRDAMEKIRRCRIPYDPIRGPNSNTTIRAVLAHCAADCTWNGGRGKPRATHPPIGWDSDEGLQTLLDCMNQAVEMAVE